MIPFSTYLRIESRAGGCGASPRALLKQTRSMLRDDVSRDDRHAIYRAVLERHAEASNYRYIRSEANDMAN